MSEATKALPALRLHRRRPLKIPGSGSRVCWSFQGPWTRESRVALAIGNGGCKRAAALPNPPNDAGATVENLERLGFDVVAGMRQVIRDFARKIE